MASKRVTAHVGELEEAIYEIISQATTDLGDLALRYHRKGYSMDSNTILKLRHSVKTSAEEAIEGIRETYGIPGR